MEGWIFLVYSIVFVSKLIQLVALSDPSRIDWLPGLIYFFHPGCVWAGLSLGFCSDTDLDFVVFEFIYSELGLGRGWVLARLPLNLHQN